MSDFKIINDSNEITLSNKWVPSNKFNSKDRLVDANGNKVGSDYKGRQYRIIEKREHTFSGLERFGRGFLGTLAVICSLCFALFSKSVRNLFTNSKEYIRFAVLAPTASEKVSKDHPTVLSSVESDKETVKPESITKDHPAVSTVQDDNKTIKLEFIIRAAPWYDEYGSTVEPSPLPEDWEKHQAKQDTIVDYSGTTVKIPRGDNYFTYKGKVAIGWHGSYNPPHGM